MMRDDSKPGRAWEPLTTFSGETPGNSVLRSMKMQAGGTDGIRRVDRVDADGTTHTLFTRAGMPTVITKRPDTIASRFHGLCRQLAVYVGLTEEVSWQPSGYEQPTSGDTRYFKAPGTPKPPTRVENPADYSKTIGDYALLVSGEDYLPIENSTALTGMQWLFEGEGGAVRVLGLELSEYTNLSHTFYVRDYGPFRKTTPGTPFVVVGTLGTITVTSTSSYLETEALVASPEMYITGTGNTDRQNWDFGRTGFEPLDTQLPEDSDGTTWTGSPDHVRTTGTFQVQASPNGRQIAVMRGAIDMNDPYSEWHQDKYSVVMMHTTILTVATVDISSSMVVGAPVDVFQWEYHFPTDFEADAIIDAMASGGYYVSLGTWWIAYRLRSIHSSGTPYTLRECMNFYYGKDGVLHLSYIEKDYGPVQEQNDSISGPVSFMYVDTGIPSVDPEPDESTIIDDGTLITRTSYEVTAGFGWGITAMRSSIRTESTDTEAVSSMPYYRLTNNVLMLTEVTGGPNFFGYNQAGVYGQLDYSMKPEIFTPTSRDLFETVFPVSSAYSHFVSYNTETEQLAASNDGTGPICWV